MCIYPSSSPPPRLNNPLSVCFNHSSLCAVFRPVCAVHSFPTSVNKCSTFAPPISSPPPFLTTNFPRTSLRIQRPTNPLQASLLMQSDSASESSSLLQHSSEKRESPNWALTWHVIHPYLVPPTRRLCFLAVVSFLCAVLGRAVALLPPFAYKLAVDALTADLVTGAIFIPYLAVAVYILAEAAESALKCLSDLTYAITESNVTRRFSVALFGHLMALSLTFHLESKTGEIAKVVDRAVGAVDTLLDAFLFRVFPTIIEAAVVTFIFVRLGSPYIALTVFLTVIAYFVFTVMLTERRNKIRLELNDFEDRAEEKAIDKLINYETVKTFAMEKEETSNFSALEGECVEKYIRFKWTLNILNFGQQLIRLVGIGIAMLLAAKATVENSLSPGSFVLIVTYVTQLFRPLVALGYSFKVITQAVTDIERSVKILATEISVKDAPNAVVLDIEKDKREGRPVGEIRFENVSFQYKSRDETGGSGVQSITFRVERGKTVALVGESGSGKSTITRLLLRFYDTDSGNVLVNGRDVREYTQRSLRRSMGVVAQDTMLFNDTLRYNITYGNDEASDVEIMSVARSAALSKFISSLPDGLDTVVGELGVKLSGGEKQRVGYARCIMKKPMILLLDEASSSLDTITEKEMQANLEEVCRNRTTLIIAHRLSTVMMADEILVLGKTDSNRQVSTIIERGTHEELLAAKGMYANMWNAQVAASHGDDEQGVKTIAKDGVLV